MCGTVRRSQRILSLCLDASMGPHEATEFLVAVRAARGGQTGNWQPWVAMGSAKATKEALARY